MTITLRLSEEQARRLERRAAQEGKTIEAFLLGLAEQALLTNDEWEALADELTQLVPDTVPPIPDEALSRDTMYRE